MAKFLSFTFILFVASCGFKSLPTAKNEVEAKWAEVLNQYKRRSDLIPNLVKTVKGYASHEKETLSAVIEARSKATSTTINANDLSPEAIKKMETAQQGLTGALSKLMMVSERYPDLKANQNFRDLQNQLEGTENRITVSRNRYIETVKQFNNLVTVPPESWTNSLYYKFEKLPQFSVANEETIKEAPKVDFE
jgi:LemA protein